MPRAEPRVRSALLLLAGALLAGLPLAAAPAPGRAAPRADEEGSAKPRVEPASDEGERAIAAFEVAADLDVALFAAEPMLANPVCLAIDEHGVVYVGETFRHHDGVTDIREHMDWLDDDLAARTVDDRLALLRRHLGDDLDTFARATERVRRLVDEDGDGRADTATVFADGFASHLDGIGAGLLARDGDVYYTCIPSLYRLRDADDDGVADERDVLSTGYGVRIALLGHDLHGLCIGPDGRLYFSVGDRGLHVETPDGVLSLPGQGAVLRCELDGSALEIVHRGLRNPQELAFDDHGNLFTADNNSDGGDRARWVWILPDADSGWRQPYQWLRTRGPWNAERLWEPHFDGQAAYLLPPIGNLSNGPSGLASYPGTGLDERYAGAFFLCDFLGEPSMSGVHAVTLERDGSSFRLAAVEHALWGLLATDADFGPDGALYVTDWVAGWNQTGKGRVYRVTGPDSAGALARQTQAILARGVAGRPTDALARLLAHPDRRVRQRAQFELVGRGEAGRAALVAAAHATDVGTLPRLHGIWGLGMLARRGGGPVMPAIAPLLDDAEVEVRAQAVAVVGELDEPGAARLLGRLDDADARVRLHAAIAVGRRGLPGAVAGLAAMLRRDGESDPYLRHAAVTGLDGCADAAAIERLAADEHPQVRLGAVLVMRRREDAGVARSLADIDARVRVEAARAIHDVPIDAAMPALAALLERRAVRAEPLLRRALDANVRVGGEPAAARLATFAAREDVDAALRVLALDALAEWGAPSPKDLVLGRWAPLPERDDAFVAPLAVELGAAADDAPVSVARAWCSLVERAGAADAAPTLARWALDAGRDARVRVDALEALDAVAAPAVSDHLDALLVDASGEVRAAALEVLERREPAEALPRLPAVLADGDLPERRAALRILARAGDPAADAMLLEPLQRLAAGRLSAELALDVVLAAEARAGGGDPSIAASLAAHAAARAAEQPELAPFLDGLFGGDADRGRAVFERADLACVRCHAAPSDDALTVGPPLDDVGERLPRRRLLESIVLPNLRAARGYTSTNLFLAGGDVLVGRVLSEDDAAIRVQDADGVVHEIEPSRVERRREGISAMPEGLADAITREEMRDLLAYLGTR